MDEKNKEEFLRSNTLTPLLQSYNNSYVETPTSKSFRKQSVIYNCINKSMIEAVF
jgi:hypothetical protein